MYNGRVVDTLKEDDSGQFILLMSIIIAIALVIILVYLNQSLEAGYSSSQSIMSFPKNDIRDFRCITLNEAYVLGLNANTNITGPDSFNDNFNGSFNQFINETEFIYAEHGVAVNVTYMNSVENTSPYMCEYINVSLYYYDGSTMYTDTANQYLL